MIRSAFTILVVGFACAVVDAQNPLAPGQRADAFKRNRTVVKNIVDTTVASALNPNDDLMRADGYYPLLLSFNQEIAKARDAKDGQRVLVLSKHLETLLDKGLSPTLEKARVQVAGGTNSENYPQVKEQLLSQLDALMGSLNDKSTKTLIESAKGRLLEMTGPKK
jgi:hypothetical protein